MGKFLKRAKSSIHLDLDLFALFLFKGAYLNYVGEIFTIFYPPPSVGKFTT